MCEYHIYFFKYGYIIDTLYLYVVEIFFSSTLQSYSYGYENTIDIASSNTTQKYLVDNKNMKIKEVLGSE